MLVGYLGDNIFWKVRIIDFKRGWNVKDRDVNFREIIEFCVLLKNCLGF